MKRLLLKKTVPLVLILLLLATMSPLSGLATQSSGNGTTTNNQIQAQYETDFSANEAGEQPAGWTSRWNPVEFIVQDAPRRLVYEPSTGSRSLITFDEAGEIEGDVEVAGVVRAPSPMSSTRFQLHLHASGDASSTQSYYVDVQNDTLRLNRYSSGSFHSLKSVPFSDFTANRWFQVVLQRSGENLRAKVWPYGADEPDDWMIETTSSVLDGGSVGVGHFGTDTVNEWAWFAVGTGGEPAPRAPKDLLSEVDKSFLQNRADEIQAKNLNEANFTEDSWQALEGALAAAENVLNDPEAKQSDVDAALASLNEAYAELEFMSAQFETTFAESAPGEPPVDWTPFWQESSWTVLDEPSRLEHVVTPGGKRRALTWDEVGEVHGDTEVSGLVRASGTGTTMFQLALHVSGDSGSENSYYLDMRTTDYVRINRNLNSSFSTLKTAKLPFAVEEYPWYHAVLQREGDTLRGKVWPYGEEEPADWQIEVVDDAIDRGRVGVSHVTSGRINEWAFFGVGTGGEPAPRAPDDLIPPPEEPDRVTGVAVDQGYGFATVSWDPSDGAVVYEIERTPMNGDNPDGTGEVVGRWYPNRYDGGELTFADSGFVLGERYRWRVRAVGGGIPGDWSDPVISDTKQLFGPDDYLTEFELNGGEEWTSLSGEQQLLQAIADASERVRLEEIGRTAQGFPLNLAIIGDPEPKTPEEIAHSPSVLISCSIHGTEPAPREACMMLLRELAFSENARVSDILEDATVLIVPTANPEGRSVNQRQNSAGQDLNRDHWALRHPETFALARVMRDYQPDMVIDGHEYQAADASDLSAMWARSPNVGEELWVLSQNSMTHGELFNSATDVGWWPLQYPLTPTHGSLHNTSGLKNKVGLLLETRRRPGPTRPAEGDASTLVTTPESQKRRTYTHLWAFRQMLDYYQQNISSIQQAIAASRAAAIANEGPVYLDGMRDVPVTPPVNRPPTLVLDPAPCGYFITDEQYTRVDGQVSTVQERLDAHGIEVKQVPDGVFVTMEQPLRGLIPLVLDPEAPYGMVSAERLYDCGDLDPSPEPDKTELQNRVNEILDENLNEEKYTKESWQALQNKLMQAEEVLNNPDVTQSEINDALEDLNEAREGLKLVSTSVSDIQALVDRFADEGEFANESALRLLRTHLTAVSIYEGKEQADKVVKHMEGFKLLLDYQRENALISEKAYNALYDSAETLIEKWQ